jgi:hypothetical protein
VREERLPWTLMSIGTRSATRRATRAVAVPWLGCASAEAATRTFVSRKTESAAIVAVHVLAQEIAADPGAALDHRGLEVEL